MADGNAIAESFSKWCSHAKVQALENTLLQSFTNFKGLVSELEGLYTESECHKSKILIQKELCQSKSCAGSESLKQVIVEKDKIIQSIVKMLIELNDTKNFNIVNDVFRMISGEQSPLTPPTSYNDTSIYKAETLRNQTDDKNLLVSEVDGNILSSEIEDTLTGRKSPIIRSKKILNSSLASVDNSKVQEKKKYPETWPTPEKKVLKLTFPTPGKGKSNAKFKQARLNFVQSKSTTVVDLTNSPAATREFSCDSNIENIKKETIENDDTILPSPTSGRIDFPSIYKTVSKNSPRKLRKSLSVLKLKGKDNTKCENKNNNCIEEDMDVTDTDFAPNILKESNRCRNGHSILKKQLLMSKIKTECTTFIDNNDENKCKEKIDNKEESINILRNFTDRFHSSPPKQALIPLKCKQVNSENINESISLLQGVNKLVDRTQDVLHHPCSPGKRSSTDCEIEPSMSVLHTNFTTKVTNTENIQRTRPDVIEPIFKEPTVRKKLEKLALPGWSCDECKEFYDELYKDNAEMLRQKMEECSRHRGRRDPGRARTPPGFWQPRWHVPHDTDEFNRLNDAL